MAFIIKKSTGQEVSGSFDRENAKVEVKYITEPTLGRIVIAGKWDGEISYAKRLLHKVCDAWPNVQMLDCLITPAAFLNIYWVNPSIQVENPREPAKDVLGRLITKAQEQCDLLLQDKDLRQKLKSQTRYLVIGIDITPCKDECKHTKITKESSEKKKKKGGNYPLHAEMAAIFDLANGEGKVIRFDDIDTHFFDLKIGRTLVLVCHDLKVFSSRGKATTKSSWRKGIRDNFCKKVKEKEPEFVLHLYHYASSSRTWTSEWNELKNSSKSIKHYTSSGVYQVKVDKPNRLEDILEKTKCGNTLDFIIKSQD
jgi:hypothetical protein